MWDLTVERFASPDGTEIACHRSGNGPDLVVVHGTGADHSTWIRIAPILAQRLTLHLMDRRGRGASGDGTQYSLEREVEDVIAVLDSIGGPAHLYGHSFGGACALEAALRTRVRSVTLYEGGLKREEMRFFGQERVAQLQGPIDAGRPEETLIDFMQHEAGLNASELEALRASPSWPGRVAAANTIPRELRALDAYGTDFDRVRGLGVPLLCLVGGASIPRRREGFTAAARSVNAAIVELPAQGHAAHLTAPQLLADTIADFVSSVDAGLA